MHKLFSCVTFAVCAAIASTAAAGELKLSIANGRATLIATDVPVRQILAEWARIGETKVVNGDRMVGPNLTLQLVDRPEREVLDAVLRSAAGYVAAPRSAGDPRLSVYDRILILPTSQAPAFNPAAASTPTFVQPARPMPVPMPDEDPADQPPNVVVPPGAPGMPLPPGAQQVPQTQPAPQTLPRPGMLPPPQTGTPNPYAPAPYTPTPNSPMVRPPGAPLPPGVKPPGGGGG